jgi:hypothetical protein
MPSKQEDPQDSQKDYNALELETIAALRAEGHDSFEEMVGPLRRRMSEKTGQPTRQTPALLRIIVVMAGLVAVGLLFFVKFAG